MSSVGTPPTSAPVHRAAPRWVTAPVPPHSRTSATAAAAAAAKQNNERPRSMPNTPTSDASATGQRRKSTTTAKSSKPRSTNSDAPLAGPSTSKPKPRPTPPTLAPRPPPESASSSYVAGPLSAALAARSPLWRATHPQASGQASGASTAASSSTTTTKPGKQAQSTASNSSPRLPHTTMAPAAAAGSSSTKASTARASPATSSSTQPRPSTSALPPKAVRPRVSTATATPPPRRSITPSSARPRGSSELQTDGLDADGRDRRASSSYFEGSAEPSGKKKKKAPRRGWKGWAIEVVDEFGNKSIRSPSPEPEPTPDQPKRRRGRPKKLASEEPGQEQKQEQEQPPPAADGERDSPAPSAVEDQLLLVEGEEEIDEPMADHEPEPSVHSEANDEEIDVSMESAAIEEDGPHANGEAAPENTESAPMGDEGDPAAEEAAAVDEDEDSEMPAQALRLIQRTKARREASIARKEARKAERAEARAAKRARDTSPDRQAKRLRSRASSPTRAPPKLIAPKSEPRPTQQQTQPLRKIKPRQSEPTPVVNGNYARPSAASYEQQATDGHVGGQSDGIPSPPESALRSTRAAPRVVSGSKKQGTLDAYVTADGDSTSKKQSKSSGGQADESDEAGMLNKLPNVDEEARFIIASASKEREQRQREHRDVPMEPEEASDDDDEPQLIEHPDEHIVADPRGRRQRPVPATRVPSGSREARDKSLRGREFQDHEWSAVLHDKGRKSVDMRDDHRDGHSVADSRDPRDRPSLSPRLTRDRDGMRLNGHHPQHVHHYPPHDPRFYPAPPYGYYAGYYPPYPGPMPPHHLHPSHQFPMYPPPHHVPDGSRHAPYPPDGRPRPAESEWAQSSRRAPHEPRERVGLRPIAPMPPHPLQKPTPPAAAPARQLGPTAPSGARPIAPRLPPETATAHPAPPVTRRHPAPWTGDRVGYTDVVPVPFPAGPMYQGPPDPHPPSLHPDFPALILAPRGNDPPRPSNPNDLALSKAYADGYDGLDPSLEENARGFVENVKNNLRQLVSTYFNDPSTSRDAFLERIGRDLTSLGWDLTDLSDGALYTRAGRVPPRPVSPRASSSRPPALRRPAK